MKKTKIFAVIGLLVKWSGIAMTDGRGKVGGSVLSKSRSGATVRNKVTPINRRSAAQSQVRALLTSFAQTWRSLTQSQRNQWNEAANNGYTSTNIFGDVVKKSGLNLYTSLNINLQLVGGTAIVAPPSPDATPAPMYSIAPVADVSNSEIFIDADFGGLTPSVVPADMAVLIYATPKLSPGVSYVKSQLRILTVLLAADDTASKNIYSSYAAKYGAPAVGDNIVIAAQVVNTVGGSAGTPQQLPITISA